MTIERAPKTVHPTIGLYLSGLRAGESRRSVRSRLRAVAEFFGYPTVHDAPWGELDYEHVQTILNWCRERGLAPNTVNHYRSVLLGVARTAFLKGEMSERRYRRIQAVPRDKGCRLPAGRDIEDSERQALLDSCDGTVRGVRDRAILEVLHSTGLRASELVGLDGDAYNARDGALSVLGKGDRERTVWLTAAARAALESLLERVGQDGPIFQTVTKWGRFAEKRLSTRGLAHALSTRCKSTGVAAVSPHDFRRTHVGDLLDAGVDLAVAQRLLGHGDPSTTSRYDRRSNERLKEAVMRLESGQ